jgi:hypothetical protein
VKTVCNISLFETNASRAFWKEKTLLDRNPEGYKPKPTAYEKNL